jgi:hypothetical protein
MRWREEAGSAGGSCFRDWGGGGGRLCQMIMVAGLELQEGDGSCGSDDKVGNGGGGGGSGGGEFFTDTIQLLS